LEKGKFTEEPVQSQFGWHVIKLEDSRTPSAPAFDEVKDRVKSIVQRKRLQAYLEDLKKTAKIEKNLPADTPAATATPAPAPAAAK
jgi:peptidyl-prolyl cis-trans isomerase C